jgi:hypothetical protein
MAIDSVNSGHKRRWCTMGPDKTDRERDGGGVPRRGRQARATRTNAVKRDQIVVDDGFERVFLLFRVARV